MPTVQSDYNEQMPPDWASPEQRQKKRAAYWSARCDYLDGKIAALDTVTLALVRLVIECSREEGQVQSIEQILSALQTELPSAPPQNDRAAHFADGWNEVLGVLNRELHN